MMTGAREMHPLKVLATTVGGALLVWGLLFAYLSSPAWASTITVTTTTDEQTTNGTCSLREAIEAANTNTAVDACVAGSATENDVINFALPGTAPWTVNLTTELPPLTSNIEIDGPGADQLTVRRADTAVDNFRIFTVSGDTTVVTIKGMTISNGNTVDNTKGGGILIADSGIITVTDSTITGNSSEFANGGGIRNEGTGTVTVTDSTIRNNFSGHEGGAIANDGDGTMTVTGSTMGPENFSDSEGGGIYNEVDGTLTVTGSTITNNSTNSDGGGIYNSGTMTVTESTINGNTSGPSSFGGEGGGIYSTNELPDTDPANDPDDTTTIINSTISGNTAAGEPGIGGGVYNSFGLTVIENSTITKNTATDGRGSGVASRGNEEFASTEVLSSIISENTNTDVDFLTDFGTPTNTFLSRGYNLIGDGNATTPDNAFNQTGDQTGVAEPGLGALADNGDPTLTHALLTGSPAIDAGPPTDGDPIACPPPSTDQRGISRPQGNACDIGSFELESDTNSAPQAQDDTYATEEDSPLTVDVPGVLSNDTDADDDPLTALKASDPTHGTLTLNSDGSFTYTPNANFSGSDSFTYKANDGSADSGVATVSISVTAANDGPAVSVAQGGSCGSASDMRGTINLALSDPDDSPQSLTLRATSSNRDVVPSSNITFGGGTDASRTMTVSSLTGSGTSNVTITLSDGDLNGTVVVRVISGSAANNTLTGSANADMIFARKGSDTLSAQGANDLMCAGNGNDKLTGGLGADHFGGGSGTDTATDFNASQGDT